MGDSPQLVQNICAKAENIKQINWYTSQETKSPCARGRVAALDTLKDYLVHKKGEDI